MSLAKNLKRIRTDMGMSQVELAKAAGVSQQSISQLERGIDLTSKKLPAIAAALGCQLIELDSAYAGIAPTIKPTQAPTKPKSPSTVTARLGDLFAAILKADEDVQIEAVKVLERVAPTDRQRSRLIKTKAQS